MKNILAISMLILATTRVVYSFQFPEISPFGFMIMGFFEMVKQQFMSDSCPGVCMPRFLTFICRSTESDQCRNKFFTSSCCTFTDQLSDKSAKKCSSQQDNEDIKRVDTAAPVTSTAPSTPGVWFQVCPGTCVWSSRLDTCEAYIDVPGICRYRRKKCCVSRSSFADHPALVVIKEKENTSTTRKPTEVSTNTVAMETTETKDVTSITTDAKEITTSA